MSSTSQKYDMSCLSQIRSLVIWIVSDNALRQLLTQSEVKAKATARGFKGEEKKENKWQVDGKYLVSCDLILAIS